MDSVLAQPGTGCAKPRKIGDYVVSGVIGKGSFAHVLKGRNERTGDIVAIKEIPISRLTQKLLASLESEIAILQKARHKNIVQLYGIKKEFDRTYLFLEYCGGGDLSQYIKRHGPMKEADARVLMRQLAEGLKVLRALNLIHRDLKPQNLLLSSTPGSAGSQLKISDFGFARYMQPQGLAETLCGSPLYMAVEILQYQKYDAKADLWSVGAILYEVVTGRPPFNGENHVDLLRNIERGSVKFPPSLALSDECKSLLNQLLKKRPVERISFEEFFAHPFLSESKHSSPREKTRNRSSKSQQAHYDVRTDYAEDDHLPFEFDEDHGERSPPPRQMSSSSKRKNIHSSSPAHDAEHDDQGPSRSVGGSNVSLLRHWNPLSLGLRKLSSSRPKSEDNEQNSFGANSDEYVLLDSDCSMDNKQENPPPSSSSVDAAGASRISSTLNEIASQSKANGEPEQAVDDELNVLQNISLLQRGAYEIDGLCRELQHEINFSTARLGREPSNSSSDKLACLSMRLLQVEALNKAMSLANDLSDSKYKDMMSKQGEKPSSLPKLIKKIESDFIEAVSAAQKTARRVTEPESTMLPYAADIIYQRALQLARDGASQELMAHYEKGAAAYHKAEVLLRFVWQDCPKLPLSPSLRLSPADVKKLEECSDAVRARKEYCKRAATLQ